LAYLQTTPNSAELNGLSNSSGTSFIALQLVQRVALEQFIALKNNYTE
jgi:hypothetical protein